MTANRLPRFLKVLAFVALMPALMGGACGGGGGGLPQGTIYFDVDTFDIRSGKPRQVAIRVLTDYEFHAFEIDVQAEPGPLGLHSVIPVAPFDDNGILFTTPEYHLFNGSIKNIVDFRHGNLSATGPITIAEFTMYPNNPTPETYLSFANVRVLDADGNELNLTAKTNTFAILP